jgi:hypothetical protein
MAHCEGGEGGATSPTTTTAAATAAAPRYPSFVVARVAPPGTQREECLEKMRHDSYEGGSEEDEMVEELRSDDDDDDESNYDSSDDDDDDDDQSQRPTEPGPDATVEQMREFDAVHAQDYASSKRVWEGFASTVNVDAPMATCGMDAGVPRVLERYRIMDRECVADINKMESVLRDVLVLIAQLSAELGELHARDREIMKASTDETGAIERERNEEFARIERIRTERLQEENERHQERLERIRAEHGEASLAAPLPPPPAVDATGSEGSQADTVLNMCVSLDNLRRHLDLFQEDQRHRAELERIREEHERALTESHRIARERNDVAIGKLRAAFDAIQPVSQRATDRLLEAVSGRNDLYASLAKAYSAHAKVLGNFSRFQRETLLAMFGKATKKPRAEPHPAVAGKGLPTSGNAGSANWQSPSRGAGRAQQRSDRPDGDDPDPDHIFSDSSSEDDESDMEESSSSGGSGEEDEEGRWELVNPALGTREPAAKRSVKAPPPPPPPQPAQQQKTKKKRPSRPRKDSGRACAGGATRKRQRCDGIASATVYMGTIFGICMYCSKEAKPAAGAESCPCVWRGKTRRDYEQQADEPPGHGFFLDEEMCKAYAPIVDEPSNVTNYTRFRMHMGGTFKAWNDSEKEADRARMKGFFTTTIVQALVEPPELCLLCTVAITRNKHCKPGLCNLCSQNLGVMVHNQLYARAKEEIGGKTAPAKAREIVASHAADIAADRGSRSALIERIKAWIRTEGGGGGKGNSSSKNAARRKSGQQAAAAAAAASVPTKAELERIEAESMSRIAGSAKSVSDVAATKETERKRKKKKNGNSSNNKKSDGGKPDPKADKKRDAASPPGKGKRQERTGTKAAEHKKDGKTPSSASPKKRSRTGSVDAASSRNAAK